MDCPHDWAHAPDYNCDRCSERTREFVARTARSQARPHEVDDVVSDALNEILRRQMYDPLRGSFPRFVRMVVKNATNALGRRSARHQRNVDAMGQLTLQRHSAGGVEWAVEVGEGDAFRAVELRIMLDDVLADLKPEDREAFALHLADYTLSEIAERVQVRGGYISRQRWGQRLRPIQDMVCEALDLLNRGDI